MFLLATQEEDELIAARITNSRMRFGLRTLLALTTILAGISAFFGSRYARVTHQRSLIATLQASGARVRVDWPRRSWLDKTFPWLPHTYKPIAEVQAGDAQSFGDDDLTPVLSMREITGLELQNTSITDEGLRRIAASDLANLTSINLSDTGVTDEGLTHLASLPNLKAIVVSGCDKLTEAGVERFRKRCGRTVKIHGLPTGTAN